MHQETTLDGLLNHRVKVEQPAEGFRIAVDTVLLAASVNAKGGDKVFDCGCGVGGVMLCLAARVSDICITGIEIQRRLVDLCRSNITSNNFQNRLEVREGDLTDGDTSLPMSFDHVMMNPPFHDGLRHPGSDLASKRRANTDRAGQLALWIDSAAAALKEGGALNLIHRADRLDEIVTLVSPLFGEIEFLPILPKAGAQPKRIILRAKKGKEVSVKQRQSLILHSIEGGYTKHAETILRDAKALEFMVI